MKTFLCLGLFLATFFGLQAQNYPSNGKALSERTSFMSPGAGYSFYFPLDKNLGVFQGVSTEFTFVAHHNPYSSGPSNFRLYTRLAILNSNAQDSSIGGMITYNFGGAFSLEGGVKRDFLVPYCGLEMGGINQRNLGGGFTIAPLLGLQIYNSKYFTLQAQASYNYSTKFFDRLSGLTANVGLNVYFWTLD